MPLPFFADAVAPGIVTAQAIGRLGNWFNQELYGGPTTLPWGLEIYRRVNPETGAPDSLGGVALDRTPIEIVHPTFLYELLWNLLVAALVVWADRRFRLGHGRAFAVYVAGYTAGRFWIEQMRTDYATRVFGDLRINVVVSAWCSSARCCTWCWCASRARSPPTRRSGRRRSGPARTATRSRSGRSPGRRRPRWRASALDKAERSRRGRPRRRSEPPARPPTTAPAAAAAAAADGDRLGGRRRRRGQRFAAGRRADVRMRRRSGTRRVGRPTAAAAGCGCRSLEPVGPPSRSRWPRRWTLPGGRR